MHDHSHSSVRPAVVTGTNAFIAGIGLNVAFVIIEIIAGLLYKSVALLSDAGHNVADIASLLISFVAFKLARRKATEKFTYGLKKTTVLASLANAVLLLIAVGVLGYESVNRFSSPPLLQGNIIAWVAGE